MSIGIGSVGIGVVRRVNMTPRATWRRYAYIAAALLLAGCAGGEAEKRDQAELVRTLVDAAAAAQKQNDAPNAVNYYRSALARDPDNIAAAIGLMQTLRLTGGLDEARSVAAKALSTKPADPGILAEAGKVKLATGQIDEAIKLLQSAVAADTTDWKSRSALGLAYDRVGDYAKAEDCYAEALAIAPDSASVLNNYALSRAMANDLPAARDLLQRAAAEPDADIRVRQNLALVYALSGNMAKAEELTRRDLPPALVRPAIDYYRQLAASAATKRQ
jgi:Flp pilus assembly protein TadD